MGGKPKVVGAPTGTESARDELIEPSRMLKLSENPPTLHPAGGSLRDLGGRWWVMHCKPRNEKALAWDLVDRNVPYFLPMTLRTTFSGGRKRRGMIPLFPSYIFLNGRDEQRHAALTTNRIVRAIEAPDQQLLITELDALERALREGAEFDLYPFAVVGQRCRVRKGPFEGVEGTVVSRDSVARLVLQVSLLGCGAVMEVDVGLLEAV